MRKKTFSEKFFEKIPPAVTWTLILLPIVGAVFFPNVLAYFVLVFNVYFLYKSAGFATWFIISFLKILETERVDWVERLNDVFDPKAALEKIEKRIQEVQSETYDQHRERLHEEKRVPWFLDKLAFQLERRKVISFLYNERDRLRELSNKNDLADWRELHHVVIVPHYKEPINVLETTLEAISKSSFPTKQISICMGAEARDPEGKSKSKELMQKYADTFENFWINVHVMAEDEIVGKSSNMASAGKYVKKQVAKLGWNLEKVTITSCDSDSILPRDYFAQLSYMYISDIDSKYKYYVGAILFYANIWKISFFARVKNSLSVLYNIGKLTRTDKLIPFSTYTTSLWLIDQIGYWTPWVTPEDFHLFFKGLFKFPDKVAAVPIHQRVYSHAAEGEGHLDTFKNNYFQSRRWAWGVSDDGWLIRQCISLFLQGKLTLRALYRTLQVLNEHTMGLVMTVILVLGGNLPFLINEKFASTVFGTNLPIVSSFMVQITVWFLILLIILDHYFVKPPKENRKMTIIDRLFALLEWVTLPYVGFLLVIIPGVEAHTRLIFGKYLEYYLTKKK